MPTPQDVRKKGSKILKLPPVRNCFTLAMTNKLVVIINSLKVPKIKNILLYELKFLVPNLSCLQNSWLGGCRPQILILSLLFPQLNLLNPPPNKIPGYSTENEWCMDFSYGFQVRCISRKRNTPYGWKKNMYGKVTYSKLKRGPISQLQGRPVITGKHMRGAELLVIGVFFSPSAIFYFTKHKLAVLYFSKCWDVQK